MTPVVLLADDSATVRAVARLELELTAARSSAVRAAHRHRPLQGGQRHRRSQPRRRGAARVAGRLSGALRTEDLVGRWGGEEFLALLPHTGLDAARASAERLRRAVSAEPIGVDGHALTVTVSIGGASADAHRGDHALLSLADEQLYAAKAAGRDRIQVFRSQR